MKFLLELQQVLPDQETEQKVKQVERIDYLELEATAEEKSREPSRKIRMRCS